jgi:hypothetical protein
MVVTGMCECLLHLRTVCGISLPREWEEKKKWHFWSRNLIEFDMCNTRLVDIIGQRHGILVPVATNQFWRAINFALVYSSRAPLSDVCHTFFSPLFHLLVCTCLRNLLQQKCSIFVLETLQATATTMYQKIQVHHFWWEKCVSCYQIFNYFQFMVEIFQFDPLEVIKYVIGL